MRYSYIYCLALLLAASIFSLPVSATHIRAGEIIAERISTQNITYRFTIIGYTDEESPVQFGNGILDFGDGNSVRLNSNLFTKSIIAENVGKNVYSVEHTYPSPGQYTISYQENNRNADILTMANSVQTPFYVETMLIIDPSTGSNSSPVLLIPPIDLAATDQVFFHNPGAYDADGDSLAFRLVPNKQGRDELVADFKEPNHSSLYIDFETGNSSQDGPPSYTLDPTTGDLYWDAPGSCGEYNTAFVIEEWRNINGGWVMLGYVTRDMQIIVECTENEPPELEVPRDTCVEAGALVEALVLATDPDGHNVKMEAYGSPFVQPVSPASFFPDPPVLQPTEPNPAQLYFRWQTTCSHVSDDPYKVWFKASDQQTLSNPKLATFEEWFITVVAPAPENLTAESQAGKKIALNWEAYSCDHAEKIQIWRRVGSLDFTPGDCQTGIPAGYELVAEVDPEQTSFTDDNEGLGLDVGSQYCYRLVAVFPSPGGGESYASNEACAELKVDVPLITKVDILSTSEQNGDIRIEWVAPFEIDTLRFPPPYTYEVGRAEGFTGSNNVTVLQRTQDSSFVDTGLNTKDKVYNYRIYLYDATNTLLDSSSTASSVRLEASSIVGGVRIDWTANVPWSNRESEYPWHMIYRDHQDPNDEEAVLLYDSVQVTSEGFVYTDLGKDGEELSPEEEYCYYVMTKGAYVHSEVPSPLLNRSQLICAQPNDTIPPCEPLQLTVTNIQLEDCEAFLADKPCDFDDFFNVLNWQAPASAGPQNCESDDVRYYEVFYSAEGLQGEFVKVAEVQDTTFRHTGLPSFKGCYKIRAVDRSDNAGAFSETVCVDNCPFIELPNVFTPNGDQFNDVFKPFDTPLDKCPRFVESVEISIYNRWGKLVHESTSTDNIYINWDGRAKNEEQVASGVYYYIVNVTFDVLDPNKRQLEMKGWVQVLY